MSLEDMDVVRLLRAIVDDADYNASFYQAQWPVPASLIRQGAALLKEVDPEVHICPSFECGHSKGLDPDPPDRCPICSW